MYLAWFDADRKKPVAAKIAEAHERYVAKFGRQPLVCLINPEDAIADAPVELRPLQSIGRNCFWIGADDDADEEVSAAVAAPAAERQPTRRTRKRATATIAPAPATETTAPTAALPTVTAPVETAARRPRKARQTVSAEQQPLAAPAPPAPPAPTVVSAKRRPRRERPAA